MQFKFIRKKNHILKTKTFLFIENFPHIISNRFYKLIYLITHLLKGIILINNQVFTSNRIYT